MNTDFLVERLAAAALIILVSFPFHEFAHALAAYRLGDSTAKLLGRLTLNPIAHFDPLGGILLIVSSLVGFGIGWAKPTPVNTANLEGGRRGDIIVSLAGPAVQPRAGGRGGHPAALPRVVGDGGPAPESSTSWPSSCSSTSC